MNADYKVIVYGKQEATLLKGILIIMMVIHHLFGLDASETYTDGYILCAIGSFGKICVASYAFISGFGLFLYSANIDVRKTFSRIFNLLIRYWICLTLILIFDCVTGSIAFSALEIRDMILGYMCIDFKYNANAWFVLPYLCFVVILPMVNYLMKKIKNQKIAIVLDLLCILTPLCVSVASYVHLNEVSLIYNTMMYTIVLMLPFFGIGSLFSRYNIFGKVSISQKPLVNFFMGTIFLLAVFIIRRKFNFFVYGMNVFDIIIAPVFIFSLLLIKSGVTIKWIDKLFCKFGKMSTNIWLIHFVFCQGSLKNIVIFSKSAVATFAVAMFMCILSSYVVDMIYALLVRKKLKV